MLKKYWWIYFVFFFMFFKAGYANVDSNLLPGYKTKSLGYYLRQIDPIDLHSDIYALREYLVSKTEGFVPTGYFTKYDFFEVEDAFDWVFVTPRGNVYQLRGIEPSMQNIFGWKKIGKNFQICDDATNFFNSLLGNIGDSDDGISGLVSNVSNMIDVVESNESQCTNVSEWFESELSWVMVKLDDWDHDGNGKFDWLLFRSVNDHFVSSVYKLDGVTEKGLFRYKKVPDIIVYEEDGRYKFKYFISDDVNTNNLDNDQSSNKLTILGSVKINEIPLSNAKVELFSMENKKIGSTYTDSEGNYKIEVSNDGIKKLRDEGYLKVLKDNKTFRGLIVGLSDTDSHNYKKRDTIISNMSEAVFRIKDALNLDRNLTKKIYKDFLLDYRNGNYDDSTLTSYTFAFRRTIKDIASNIEQNFHRNIPLYSNQEIIEKIENLSTLDLQEVKKARFGYSVPLTYVDGNRAYVSIIYFKDIVRKNSDVPRALERESDNIILNLKKLHLQNSDIFTISSNQPEITLKNVSLTKNFGEGSIAYLDNLSLSDTIIAQDLKKSNQQYIEALKELIKWKNVKIFWKNDDIYLKFELHARKILSMYEFNTTRIASLTLFLQENPEKAGNINSGLFGFDLNNNTAKYIRVNIPIRNSITFEIPLDGKVHTIKIPLASKRKNFKNKYVTHLEIRLASGQLLKESYETAEAMEGILFDVNQFFEMSKPIYLSIDWENNYDSATIAKLTLKDTKAGVDTTFYGDNVFINDKGHEFETIESTTTHRILDFDKIVRKKFFDKDKWQNTQYAKSHFPNMKDEEDTRVPLLLIHGWQGDPGQTNVSLLLNYDNNEFSYWHNVINLYLATPRIYKRFKLYTYHYPSYKHITFNARMLKKLLDELKQQNNTVLGKALNNDGIVILAHSMGGLVARSLIEEHKGLGENAEKLIRLITLDTPHHGSVSAITAFLTTAATNFFAQKGWFAKDLDTPGAVDLMWDNFDNKYISENPIYDTSLRKFSPWSRMQRMSEIEKYRGKFDTYYNKENGISDSLNPYLYNLNMKRFVPNLAQEKYIYYTAYDVGTISSSIINPIDSDTGMSVNSKFIESEGYSATGAEPVNSSLFSISNQCDLMRSGEQLSKILESYFFNQYILIGQMKNTENIDNCIDNYNVSYRLFYDYNHETIMNGQYKSKTDWDDYIDKPDLDNRNTTSLTNFNIDKITSSDGPLFYRELYIQSALNYFFKGKEYNQTKLTYDEMIKILKQKVHITDNPLKMEPVFLVLQRDLLDSIGINNHPPSIDDWDISTDKLSTTLSVIVTDPDGDPLTCYVDWGDGSNEEFDCTQRISHTYETAGKYTILIKAKDEFEAESNDVNIQVEITGNSDNIITGYEKVNLNFSYVPEGDCRIKFGDGTSKYYDICPSIVDHIYSLPGVYTAEVYKGVQRFDSKVVIIENKDPNRWDGFVVSGNKNIQKVDYQDFYKNGELYISPSIVDKSKLELDKWNGWYYTKFKYVNKSFLKQDKNTKKFLVAINIKNSREIGGQPPCEASMILYFDNGASIGFNWMKMWAGTGLYTLNIYEKMSKIDLKNYTKIKIVIDNDEIKLYIGYTLIGEMSSDMPLGKIVGIGVSFEGSGKIDNFEIFDDEEDRCVYCDHFDLN